MQSVSSLYSNFIFENLEKICGWHQIKKIQNDGVKWENVKELTYQIGANFKGLDGTIREGKRDCDVRLQGFGLKNMIKRETNADKIRF